MPKTFALINARGGGSTLYRKNIYPLLGKPIIQYAIETCRNTNFIDKVFVWSDDQKILDIAKKCSAFPLKRPKHMVHYFSGFSNAQDWNAATYGKIFKQEGTCGDYFVSFNCNNLLIRPETMDVMFKRLQNSPGSLNIIATKKVSPGLCLKNDHTSYLFPFWNAPFLSPQQHPDLFRVMGVSISRMSYDYNSADSKLRTLFHPVSRDEGLDFQNSEDISLAEYYLSKRTGSDHTENINAGN